MPLMCGLYMSTIIPIRIDDLAVKRVLDAQPGVKQFSPPHRGDWHVTNRLFLGRRVAVDTPTLVQRPLGRSAIGRGLSPEPRLPRRAPDTQPARRPGRAP